MRIDVNTFDNPVKVKLKTLPVPQTKRLFSDCLASSYDSGDF